MTVYKPEKELFLYKRIILWRRDLSGYKYSLRNIKKFGLLINMVYEDVTGYICNFNISYVKRHKHKSKISSLLQPFLNLWHHVYTNNYYNSVKLAQKLLKENRFLWNFSKTWKCAKMFKKFKIKFKCN